MMDEYIIKKLKITNNDITPKNQKLSKVGFIKLVWPYYLKYWPLCLVFLFFSLITSGVMIAMPIVVNVLLSAMQTNIADGKIGLEWMAVFYAGIGLLATYIVYGLVWIFRYITSGVLARRIEVSIRLKLLTKLLNLDLHFYHNKKTGDVLTKLISDTQTLGDQAQQIPLQISWTIFSLLGASIILFFLNNIVTVDGKVTTMNSTVYIIGLLIFGIALFITVMILIMYRYLRKIQYRVRKVASSINGDIQDRIHNIRLIKTSGTIKSEMSRFSNIQDDYYKLIRKMETKQGIIWGLTLAMLFSMNGVVIIVGVIYVNRGQLNPIVMVSLMMSANQIIQPLMNLTGLMNSIIAVSVSSTRLSEILLEKEQIVYKEDGAMIDKITGDLVFKDVTFKYSDDSAPILTNFNFAFKKGFSYALVGATGSGKSTISRLLLRFYDPTKGRIYVNNDMNLKDINLKSFLGHVGYVEQEPQILFGTIAENIAYGIDDASIEQIHLAAKKAKLYDFIMSIPEEFETVVGQRGHILSGGQKQRLVIARMFLRNPEVLILDEATSALDNIVEKDIQKELEQLMKGRTSIIIAHRLTTVKNVDQILVLVPGKGIAQIGTFEELRYKEGYFRDMYEASFD